MPTESIVISELRTLLSKGHVPVRQEARFGFTSRYNGAVITQAILHPALEW